MKRKCGYNAIVTGLFLLFFATGGSCYTVGENGNSRSYSDARQYCMSNALKLLRLTSQQKQDNFLASSAMNPSPVAEIWLDLEFDTTDQAYYWNTFPLSWSIWDSEPTSPTTDDCAYINAYTPCNWISVPCSTTSDKKIGCESDTNSYFFDDSGHNNKEYAKTTCLGRGEDLIVIETQAKHDEVCYEAEQGIWNGAEVWLNLKYDGNIWYWDRKTLASWTNFAINEQISPPSGNCAYITVSTGEWHVADCMESTPYVCEGTVVLPTTEPVTAITPETTTDVTTPETTTVATVKQCSNPKGLFRKLYDDVTFTSVPLTILSAPTVQECLFPCIKEPNCTHFAYYGAQCKMFSDINPTDMQTAPGSSIWGCS